MAIAAGIQTNDPNFAVPDLFIQFFPSWFEGFAFAAIAIGALVPAAVMSIAAANLFTRNLWCEYIRPGASPQEESRVAKIVSLFVKLGALAFVLALPLEYAIDLQLLGGIWMLQTLPSVIIALYTRWFHRWALLAGWAAGMLVGTLMAASQEFKPVFPVGDITIYAALLALSANLLISTVGTLILRATGAPEGPDETDPDDYDELGEQVEREPLPASPEQRSGRFGRRAKVGAGQT